MDSDITQPVVTGGQGDATRTVAVRSREAEVDQLQIRTRRRLHLESVMLEEGVPSEVNVVQTQNAVQVRRDAFLDADDGVPGTVRLVEDAVFEHEIRQRHIPGPGVKSHRCISRLAHSLPVRRTGRGRRLGFLRGT